MSDIRQARKTLASRILEGDGKASSSARRAAFNNSGLAAPLGVLVDKGCEACLQGHRRGHRCREGVGPQRGPGL